MVLLFTTPARRLSWDGTYRDRPDPNSFGLTGFGEPEAVAVLDAGKREYRLFVRPNDRGRETCEREKWEGQRSA